MGVSTIEWTDYTFNPWIGCQRVSPGCEHCYAEAYDKRWGGERWGPKAERTRTAPANWKKPLSWNARAQLLGRSARVFCASLADVFEDRFELRHWRLELFDLIRRTPALDWLLLTKRPENFGRLVGESIDAMPTNPDVGADTTDWLQRWQDGDPPANVWLGTTVEDQERATERIPHLLAAPARVRFLSCEPLLEPVNLFLGNCLCRGSDPWQHKHYPEPPHSCARCSKCNAFVGIDWVIVGGESGGKARPFALDWAKSIIDQCRAAGVAPFVKQMGTRPVVVTGATGNFRTHEGRRQLELTGTLVELRDRHGGDPVEWPEDLRVREFPEVA